MQRQAFDTDKLSQDVARKIEEAGQKAYRVMREIGVHDSFHTQLERGSVPNANTLAIVLGWLGTRFEDYVINPEPPEDG